MHRLPAIQRAKEQTVTPAARHARWPWLIGALILSADQLSKFLFVASFTPGQSRPLLPPLVYLTYVQNTGAAFGLFKGQQLLFIGISVGVIVWIVSELRGQRRPPHPLVGWAYGLILGGAAGNLIDRLRFGYVIDFIDLRVWPVFNIGDSALTIGVTLLIWQSFRCK